MQVFQSVEAAGAYRGAVVTVGNFDGVHRGHQAMIAALLEQARALKVPALAFTFDPHPIALLRPEYLPAALTTTDRKLELLATLGVDATIVYPTDTAFLDLTPRQFFDDILLGRLQVSGMVEGPNFLFGHNRAGNVETLREYCSEKRLPLQVAAAVKVGERIVSSSEIRSLIARGQVREATDLLGRPHRVRGLVVTGAQRGRTIGFPTANLEQTPMAMPPEGVYATRAWVNGTAYPAGLNIGPNPTFAEAHRKIEVHLLDFTGDLYGQHLDVDLLERLRDTRPFAGIDALKAQLNADMERVRRILAESSKE